jgi:hypothetical protein
MIRVEQGGEYPGETYITCVTDHQQHAQFEGWTLLELLAFIEEHKACT